MVEDLKGFDNCDESDLQDCINTDKDDMVFKF